MPLVEEVINEKRSKNQRNRGKKRREKKKPRRESCRVRAHMFPFSHGFTFFTIDFWDLSVNACKSVVVFVYYQLFSWFASPIKRYYTSVFRLSCVSPLFLFFGRFGNGSGVVPFVYNGSCRKELAFHGVVGTAYNLFDEMSFRDMGS